MIYLKSICAGLAAVAILTSLLVALAVIILTSMGGYWEFETWSLSTWPVMLPNVVAFSAGFWWMFRRLSSRANAV